MCTVFVGNIADGVTDEMLNHIFSLCGHVKKWKRVLDSIGSPKNFGFLEFVLAEGLLRCIRLLKDMPLLGKHLNIKTDEPAMGYLQKYEAALKEYEVSHPDSPRLSLFLEDDLRILEEINAIFKRQNLTASMQFIEKKVEELTTGPSEKPAEAVVEKPLAPKQEERRAEPEKPRKPSLTGWESSAYRERERRWEHREMEAAKSRASDVRKAAERDEKEKKDRLQLIDWLQDFNDSSFFILAMDRLEHPDDRSIERRLASANAPSFYMDRCRWRDRRAHERQRQEEADARAEAREAADRPAPEQPAGKRPGSSMGPRSKRARVPLVSTEYIQKDLIDAGYGPDAIQEKLGELRKEKIKKLIAKIPTDQVGLFSWDMDWDLMDLSKVSAWIQKNVNQWDAVKEKAALSEDLESWIVQRLPPSSMLENMEGLPDADVFLMRLWRYLIYETEATGYGLQ